MVKVLAIFALLCCSTLQATALLSVNRMVLRAIEFPLGQQILAAALKLPPDAIAKLDKPKRKEALLWFLGNAQDESLVERTIEVLGQLGIGGERLPAHPPQVMMDLLAELQARPVDEGLLESLFAPPASPEERLVEAIKNGELEQAAKALELGADLEARPTPQGHTPLGMAVSAAEEAIFTLLIQRGANPNTQNHRGITPLHLASVLSNRAHLIAPLVEAGADPNMASHNGITPLHLATSNRNHEAMVALLKAKARPNAPTSEKLSALMIAINNLDSQGVAILLHHQADMFQLVAGESAWSMAMNSGDKKIIDLFKKHQQQNP